MHDVGPMVSTGVGTLDPLRATPPGPVGLHKGQPLYMHISDSELKRDTVLKLLWGPISLHRIE